MKRFAIILSSVVAVCILSYSLSAVDITKRLIGKQDIQYWDGGATDTFTGLTSTGRTITLSDIDWMGVDVEQVFGARNQASLTAALAAIGTIRKARMWLAPGEWALESNTTITSNILLDISPGAYITLGAYNLVVQGPFNGADGCINTTGAGRASFPGEVNARWFDDTDLGLKLTYSIASCDTTSDTGQCYIYVPTDDYTISSTINGVDLGARQNLEIDLRRSHISGETTGVPIMDFTGTGQVRIRGGHVTGSAGSMPSSAILSSTTAALTGQSHLILDGIWIDGAFSKSTIIGVCTAYMKIGGSSRIENTEGAAISVTQDNKQSESSVYSTISTDQDAISLWVTDRVSIIGGDGADPVIELEGSANHIEFRGTFINTEGGQFLDIDVTDEDMRYVYLTDIRTEAVVNPTSSIVIYGDDASSDICEIHISGGNLAAATNFIAVTDAGITGAIGYPHPLRGSKNLSLIDIGDDSTVYPLYVNMEGINYLYITGTIRTGVYIFGKESSLAARVDLSGVVAGASYVNFMGARGSGEMSCVHVTIDGNQTIAAGSSDDIEFDQETRDWSAEWNTTTYSFSPDVAGLYLIQVSAQLDPGVAGDYLELAIEQNSGGGAFTEIINSRRVDGSNAAGDTHSISTVAYLTSSNSIRFTAENLGGANNVVVTDTDARTWAKITRIAIRFPQF